MYLTFSFSFVCVYTLKRQNSLQNAQMVKKLTDLERKELEGLLKVWKARAHKEKGVSLLYTGRRLRRISWCWCSFLFVVVYLYLFKCVCVSTFSFILRKIPLHFLLIHRMVVLWMFINVEYTTHFMSSWIPLGDHLIHFKVRSFYYVIFFIFQKLNLFHSRHV